MIAAAALAALVPPAAPPPQAPTPAPVSVTPRAKTPGDPHERFNRRMFAVQQRFDRRFLRPAAMGYTRAVPRPVRTGIRHFFSNLGEPLVFVNYLLQLKVGKAAETAGRFMINSTLGLAGVLDVAKTPGIWLPHRPNGFGDTLGYYGVRPGAYLFLPLVGPTTVRDLLGGQTEGLVLPLAVGVPFNRVEYQVPRGVLTGLDRRAEADADFQALLSGAVDPYATLRSVYLQDRAGEIAQLHGKPRGAAPSEGSDDSLLDPAAAPGARPPAGASELADPLADPAAPPAAAAPPMPAEPANPALTPAPPVAADPTAPVRR